MQAIVALAGALLISAVYYTLSNNLWKTGKWAFATMSVVIIADIFLIKVCFDNI